MVTLTLHQALFLAAMNWLTVWQNPHTGQRSYVKWCGSAAKCEAMIAHAVEDVELAALQTYQEQWLMLSLAMSESRLNPRARSKIGAFGLYQVNPRTVTGVLVRKACRSVNRRECDRLAALEGAQMFAAGFEECGGPRSAVYFHRTGRCGRGPNSDHVVERANFMRTKYGRLMQPQELALQ